MGLPMLMRYTICSQEPVSSARTSTSISLSFSQILLITHFRRFYQQLAFADIHQYRDITVSVDREITYIIITSIHKYYHTLLFADTDNSSLLRMLPFHKKLFNRHRTCSNHTYWSSWIYNWPEEWSAEPSQHGQKLWAKIAKQNTIAAC